MTTCGQISRFRFTGTPRLLRARRERPCHRAAEQRDELAALQLIELHPVTARLGYDRRIVDFTTGVCWPFCNRIAGCTALHIQDLLRVIRADSTHSIDLR